MNDVVEPKRMGRGTKLTLVSIVAVIVLMFVPKVWDAVHWRMLLEQGREIKIGDTQAMVLAKLGEPTVRCRLDPGATRRASWTGVVTSVPANSPVQWGYGRYLNSFSEIRQKLSEAFSSRLKDCDWLFVFAHVPLLGAGNDDIEIQFGSDGRVLNVRLPK